MKASVICASNRAAAGVYEDTTGPLIVEALEELGFDVVKLIGLKRPTAVSIAHTTEDELREAISFAIRANAAKTHADILKVWQD